MAFSGSGAMMGAGTGAGIGFMVGGPLGAGVGAVAGLAGGGFGGLFGGGKAPGLDYGMIKDRRGEIATFERNLAAARARYLTSLGNMYNQAYARFTQNVEPGFASRGLQVSGGAFASALARKTADYQAELEPIAFQAEREDLSTAETMRQNLFGSIFGNKSSMDLAGWNADRQDMRSIGGFAGQLGMMGAQKYMSRPGAGYNNYGSGSAGWDDGARTGTVRDGRVVWDNNRLGLN